MSLNNIELQDFIVGELYKDNLLVSPDGTSATAPHPAAVVQRPAPSQPVASQPVASQPIASQPVASQPIASQPIAASPATASQPAAPPPAKPAPTPSLSSIAAARSANAAANPPPAASTTTPETDASYKFLGKHLRKITILVNAPGTPFLPDDQLNFLTKILEACRLNMGDVAIINHAVAPVNITALRAQLQPTVILLFGLDPTSIRLPINFPVFKLQPYDQCTYLSAPTLDLLVQSSEDSRLLKSKLWVCLKTLFAV